MVVAETTTNTEYFYAIIIRRSYLGYNAKMVASPLKNLPARSQLAGGEYRPGALDAVRATADRGHASFCLKTSLLELRIPCGCWIIGLPS